MMLFFTADEQSAHGAGIEGDKGVQIGILAVDRFVGCEQDSYYHKPRKKAVKREYPRQKKQKHAHEFERKAELYRGLREVRYCAERN